MESQLPDHPNLDHLKKQAKSLVKRIRLGDPESIAIARQHVRRFDDDPDPHRIRQQFALHDAQYIIARTYGFESWRQLRSAARSDQDQEASIVAFDAPVKAQLSAGYMAFVRRAAHKLQRSDWPLVQSLDYVYDELHRAVPFQRLGLALIDKSSGYVISHWVRSQGKVLLDTHFAAALNGSSLEMVLSSGQPRVIGDLKAYLRAHPQSKSTALMVAEGLRSSVTCPIFVRGDPCAFLFYTSDQPHTYQNAHALLLQSALGSHISTILERTKITNGNLASLQREVASSIELERARRVQAEMLSLRDAHASGLDVAFAYEPASFVGGDVVDLVKLPDQTVLLFVGDAMGHGAEASLIISGVKGALRAVIGDSRLPHDILNHLNTSMCSSLQSYFATAACLLVNAEERWVDVALAGHYPPIIQRSGQGGLIEPDGNAGLPLGVDPDEAYRCTRLDLGPGDTIVLFTDGVVEALNSAYEAFGRARVRRVIANCRDTPSAQLLQALRKALADFQQGHPILDDVTLMAIRTPTNK